MKINDQNLLHLDQEVIIDPVAKTIELVKVGNMDDYGVSLQVLFSFLTKEWNINDELIKFEFPIVTYGERYELVNGWNFKNDVTIDLIKDFGWAVKDENDNVLESFINIKSLGNIVDEDNDIVYYQQGPFQPPIEVSTSGRANQSIKIFGDAAHGNIDNRYFFKIFLREQGTTYSSVDLLLSQNIGMLTYKSYTVALNNNNDSKIVETDANIDANAPYTGMSITYGSVTKSIGGVDKTFGVVIDANNATLPQVYEYVQRQLRSPLNINADTNGMEVRGDTAEDLLVFMADTLKTLQTSFGGVYIENFRSIDINNIIFTDNDGESIKYPFISAGSIIFNDIIQNDASSKYWMFFSNDNAATVPTGKNFDTPNAIIVQDGDNNDIKGLVGGASQVTFNYDYTSNVQRGAGSEGKDAPVTVVVAGLGGTKHTLVEGIIEESIYNIFSLVGSIERNYLA